MVYKIEQWLTRDIFGMNIPDESKSGFNGRESTSEESQMSMYISNVFFLPLYISNHLTKPRWVVSVIILQHTENW